MVPTPTPLSGVYVFELEKRRDERGFFARVWCARELAAQGLCSAWVQSSVSFSEKAGTLRGMHYQAEPHMEVKLVRCTAGSVFDVVIDLRRDSPTFRDWFGVELSARNDRVLYVPKGFAHGFITLEDETVFEYHMSEYYHPECERGVRWNDPAFGIRWPTMPKAISKRDHECPDFAVTS
jgi:dTDP-4-dehydrorhamnose 3,5-epimerase